MSKQSDLSDLDPNLIIMRVNQGIKLVKPGSAEAKAQSTQAVHTVASLSELPFNFYFLNLEGETRHMNQQSVEICGFKSDEDSRGKSLYDVSDAESAKKLIDNCNEVIAENRIKIFEELNVRNDGVSLQFLSVKAPWYNDNDEIVGIFGCSIVLGQQSLAESLLQIAQLGLLSSPNVVVSNTVIPEKSHNNETLSDRESLCVLHLCKGFTMKEIAKIIGLSPKTVETYIDRAKQKFKCRNKAELIAAFSRGSR
ncbi:MAG: LuxR C-terminal-related transcriptional regulator [Gammaproteobacteria bacterium]|nr:LuxR C-terminal-related transcriptional regulator [Gammaproteobacteria bacterium]